MRSSLRATAEGLRFIRHRPLLVAAFLTDLDAMLLGLPVALFPALNAAHFGGSPQTLGLLNAAPGVGGLLSAVLSGPAARVSRQGRGMMAGTMIWGAAIASFGLTRNLPLALAMLAVAGAADTLTVMYRGSMVQTVTPDEFRGRVSSVEYIIGTGGGPLGNVESGTVATLTTPTISAVSGGVGCLAVAALIGLHDPRPHPLSRRGRAPIPPHPSLAPHRSGPSRQPQRERLWCDATYGSGGLYQPVRMFADQRHLAGHRRIAWVSEVSWTLEVADNPDQERFEILADGEFAGFVQYRLHDGEIAFTHAQTHGRFRDLGFAGRLVQSSLDSARERHLAVLPYCPFVRNWITEHPEYANLVPPDRPPQFGL